MTEEGEKYRTSLLTTPGVEITFVDNQKEKEAGPSENPFREGGDLSREAEDILVAYKQGKLSVISQSGTGEDGRSETATPLATQASQLNNSRDITDSLLRDRKNGMSAKDKPGVVEVEHAVVPNAKKEEAEKICIPEKEKKEKCSCCVLQ